jgi:chromosome segregation ATPase
MKHARIALALMLIAVGLSATPSRGDDNHQAVSTVMSSAVAVTQAADAVQMSIAQVLALYGASSEGATGRLRALYDEIQALMESIKAAQEELADQQSKGPRPGKDEQQEYSEDLETWQEKIDQISEKIDALREEIEQLVPIIEQIEAEIDKLESDKEKAISDLRKAKDQALQQVVQSQLELKNLGRLRIVVPQPTQTPTPRPAPGITPIEPKPGVTRGG